VSVVDAQTIDITWSDNSAIEDGYKVWVTNCPGICNADFTVYYEVIAELPANATSYRTTNDYSGLYVLVEARKGFGWSYPSSPVLVPWP
jgi:hypothetical protein